ncbi:MAG: linear amide C-N hydrolase [Candidatus Aenigmarchaeota archaeon]|nr:linear amide C-N hydrolase [Candidatus Aenigmarchaeota archaeon]
MITRTFRGGHFEIGAQIGEIYRKNGMKINDVPINQQLFKRQLRVYEKHYPDLLEELRGVACGGNFNEQKTIYNFITSELRWFLSAPERSCTIFGVTNNNGAFVGRNYDWHPAAGKVFEVYKVINPGKNSFVALSDMGITDYSDSQPKNLFYFPEDAINDKGLFIGLTFAYGNGCSNGISSADAIKLVAETCSDVDDAISTFKKVPLCCPKNFFVADKNGDMAVVEHTSKKFKVVYPENGVLIQTNHYVDAELAKDDTVLATRPDHNTFLRYYETLQNINRSKSGFNKSKIIDLLGNKSRIVCQNLPGLKTIWTLAMDIKRQKYKLYWNVTGNRKSKTLNV